LITTPKELEFAPPQIPDAASHSTSEPDQLALDVGVVKLIALIAGRVP
jgi:hypothetical protein